MTHVGSSGDSIHTQWVTVVVPTCGRPEMVAAAVRSALAGDHANVVVVDDAETPSGSLHAALADGTPNVAVVASGGRGPAGARNVGVELADTPWLVFLDDDDLLERRGLAAVQHALDQSTGNVGLVFTAIAVRAEQDGSAELSSPNDLGPLFHSVRGQLVAGGFCVRRDVFHAVGGYEASLRYSENTELVLRVVDHCVRNGLAILTIESPLGSIWRRPAQARVSNSALAVKQGAEFLLSSHAEKFARDPSAAGKFHRIAGVNAARLRQQHQARNHFGRAFKLGRTRTDFIRYCAIWTPLLWRVIWRPDLASIHRPHSGVEGAVDLDRGV